MKRSCRCTDPSLAAHPKKGVTSTSVRRGGKQNAGKIERKKGGEAGRAESSRPEESIARAPAPKVSTSLLSEEKKKDTTRIKTLKKKKERKRLLEEKGTLSPSPLALGKLRGLKDHVA